MGNRIFISSLNWDPLQVHLQFLEQISKITVSDSTWQMAPRDSYVASSLARRGSAVCSRSFRADVTRNSIASPAPPTLSSHHLPAPAVTEGQTRLLRDLFRERWSRWCRIHLRSASSVPGPARGTHGRTDGRVKGLSHGHTQVQKHPQGTDRPQVCPGSIQPRDVNTAGLEGWTGSGRPSDDVSCERAERKC